MGLAGRSFDNNGKWYDFNEFRQNVDMTRTCKRLSNVFKDLECYYSAIFWPKIILKIFKNNQIESQVLR